MQTKKITAKMIAFLLSVMMLLTAFTIPVLAEDTEGEEAGTYTIHIVDKVNSEDVMFNVMTLNEENIPTSVADGGTIAGGQLIAVQIINNTDQKLVLKQLNADNTLEERAFIDPASGEDPGAGGIWQEEGVTEDTTFELAVAGDTYTVGIKDNVDDDDVDFLVATVDYSSGEGVPFELSDGDQLMAGEMAATRVLNDSKKKLLLTATRDSDHFIIGQEEIAPGEAKGIYIEEMSENVTFTLDAVKKITPTVILSQKTFVYNGKIQKPSVTVKDGATVLKEGVDYEVRFDALGKAVSTENRLTVTLMGKYEGSKTVAFWIIPQTPVLKTVKAAKKGFKATWKKQTAEVNGFEIQYSLKKNFKKAKTVTVKKNTTKSKAVKKLKAKKKYYVRMRAYKTVKGKKVYSAWSKTKTVKTKK